jgi:isopenicillin-N epimerase
MVTVPLPIGPSRRAQPNAADELQAALWQRFQIEVPVIDWHDRRHIRVSCHLYNNRRDLDHLVNALQTLHREDVGW